MITNASVNRESLNSQSDYPIILNPDDIFVNLKPKLENPNPSFIVNPVTGWEVSKTDAELIDSSKRFFTKLKKKLKDTNSFNKDEFISIFNPFLEKIGKKVGISIGIDPSDGGYTRVLVEKIGFLISRDVAGLVLQACVNLEILELLEILIVNGLVEHSCYPNLVKSLVNKRRSDLLCHCIKHASDLGSSELLSILKYFLCPPADAFSSMVKVREEWGSQALLAIEKASDKSLPWKKSSMAKEAAILLMIAHDKFSTSELCLHYLLSSVNADEVVLSSAISKLNGKEMMNLIRYLGKWLKKYEKFPQAGPCPKAASMFGLRICDWVPKLEDVVKCLGIVIDENFSSLMLQQEFLEEFKIIAGVVSSLVSEAKFCCVMANVAERLRIGSM